MPWFLARSKLSFYHNIGFESNKRRQILSGATDNMAIGHLSSIKGNPLRSRTALAIGHMLDTDGDDTVGEPIGLVAFII